SDPETRAHLVDARKALHVVLDVVRQDRAALDRRWRDVGAELPSRSADSSPTREELAGLRAVLEKACTAWEGDQPDQRRAELYAQALGLAGVLHAARPALQAVTDQVTTAVDPDGSELDRLRLLLAVLLTGDTPEAVLRCLLRLEVVQVAFSGTSQDAEQEVELVQVSSARPDLLTGIQEHHFGAFYRRSWRTSDWLRGRLDGCAQLVEVLLAPDRLRQLGLGPDEALAALHDVAVGPAGSPHQEHLEARWREVEPRLAQELAPLGGTGRLPQTLPLVAARVAERLELEVLEQELPALADAIGLEDAPLVAGTNWAALYRAAAARSDRLGAADLLRLRQSAEVVGRQRVRAELTGGSDTFARTVSHAAASLTSLVGAVRGPALVRTVLSAVRGYALLVWVLVGYTTSRGTVGPHVLSMVVGVGGGLLGLALVVPGIPLVVPLTGAVLLLGAASSAGLRTCQGLGLRLAVAAGVALLALGGSIAWSVAEADAEQLRSSVITAVGKVAVVLAVLVLGWFLSRAKPPAGAGDPGVSAPRDRRRNVPAPRPASGSAKVGPPGVPPRGVRP
ncbi:MAG TPA: DUF3376 domain-containing protein, partial [Mycobacteriales bacterium]|nr:DUF3376 domain-containing protein [Mycobacteriales bacterium]